MIVVIEFYNPGRLPDNISVEDLLSNNYTSTPRNKLIADFCRNLGLIEKYGSGIRRIVDYFAAAKLPTPDFKNISEGFMVTVFDSMKNNVTENVTEKREGRILALVKNNKRLTTNELSEILCTAKRTILRDIESLKNKGRIRRIGSAKGGYWEVVSSHDS